MISSNIGQLLKQIEGASGSGKANQATGKSGQPLKFAVGHLSLTGGMLTLGVGPADQLAVAVMRAVSVDVLKTVAQSAGKLGANVGGVAGDAVKNAASGLKGLFGK